MSHPISRILGLYSTQSPAPAVTKIIPLSAAPNLPFSCFKTCLDLIPDGQTTLADLVCTIREGRWKREVENCREALRLEGKNEYDAIRRRIIPAVSLCACMATRAAGATPEERQAKFSRLLQIDADDLGDDLPRVRAIIRNAPFIVACWVSLSGDGLKAVARIPDGQNSIPGAWLAAKAYFTEHEIKIDEAPKSPWSLCFISHDPEAYFNPDTIEIVPLDVPHEAVIEVSDKDATEDTAAIWDRLMVKNKLVPLLLKGEWEGGTFASQSDADFSLACSICEETGNHAQQEEIFRDSGLYRDERKIRVTFPNARIRVAEQWAAELSAFETLDEEEDDAPAPPFPLHCLPPVAEKMAREMVRVTTAQNEPLAAAAILGTLSASIGAGLELPTGGGRTVRGNLFLLVVAESGTGKGENFTLSAAPFLDAEGEAVKAWEILEKPGIASELAVAEKRAKRFCEVAAKTMDAANAEDALNEFKTATSRAAELARKLESSPRYRVADATKEALAVAMQGQPGEAVASMSSEARGIFSIVKGRYGKEGGDEDFYCSGYSGDTLTVDRIGRQRVTLHRPCLSILWMVQPDAARTALADPSLMESGMIPRFLMFDPKAEPKERFEHPEPIAPVILSAWSDLIRALVRAYRNNGNEPAAVNPSAEATAALDEFERETVRRRQRAGDLADVAAFVSRWAENACRLALVLHSARHGIKAHTKPLESDTARDAIEILRWFAARQLELLHRGRMENWRKDLLALLALLAKANGKITFRKLRRSHSLEDKKIRDIHSFFPHAFNIVRCETGGRPSWAVTSSDSKIERDG